MIYFPVDELVPEDEDVTGLVRHLRLNRTVDLSGINAENIRSWMRVATWEE